MNPTHALQGDEKTTSPQNQQGNFMSSLGHGWQKGIISHNKSELQVCAVYRYELQIYVTNTTWKYKPEN